MGRKPGIEPANKLLSIRVTNRRLDKLKRFADESQQTVASAHKAIVEEFIDTLPDADAPGSNMTHDPSAGLLTVQPNPTLDA